MSAPLAVLAATGSNSPTYADDVFSSFVYTGNGGTGQTITNGIDLAGKGGLVWMKDRGNINSNYLFDTIRGGGQYLVSDSTGAGASLAGGDGVTAFNSTGFSIKDANGYGFNTNNHSTVSWTFRKAAKFFDCGVFLGTNSTNRRIPHSLGVAPGLIILRSYDNADQWWVYHKDLGTVNSLVLNTTAAAAVRTNTWGTSPPTSTDFGLDEVWFSANGRNMVWYAFAHDSSPDGIVQCGFFDTNASGNATVTLGWEPQFIIYKGSSFAGGHWRMQDSMRGLPVGAASTDLYANLSNAEGTGAGTTSISPTGFSVTGYSASSTFIYLAIRRPNKPPTTGTQVYNAIARTGTGAAATVTGVGFAPDLMAGKGRTGSFSFGWVDRLRGPNAALESSSTGAESSSVNFATAFGMDGITLGSSSLLNENAIGQIEYFLRRAPGVFDVVCYTGDGTSSRAISHNLKATPQLGIWKARNAASAWNVQIDATGQWLVLNTTAALATGTAKISAWDSSTVTLNTVALNGTGDTYVAYLFATKAGISYVGSYTGNGGTAGTTGTSQNLDFGFSAGARFVMIKATNATGDWFVWDSTRGIVASTDPHLSLNTTAAEVTTDDSVDPLNAGITVNQLAATDLNVTGRTYLVLAFA